MELKKNIIEAAQDLKHLLNRGYNKKGALKLVGDRYLLDKEERHVLFRAIFAEQDVKDRKSKMSFDCFIQ